jgi:hypothetical protein
VPPKPTCGIKLESTKKKKKKKKREYLHECVSKYRTSPFFKRAEV